MKNLLESMAAEQEITFEYGLRRALTGRTADAIKFLRICALFIEHGAALPRPYAEYLAERFKSIAETGKPFAGRVMVRKRGQNGADQLDRHHLIAQAVHTAHNKRGETLEKACASAAEKFGVSEATAKRHYTTHFSVKTK